MPGSESPIENSPEFRRALADWFTDAARSLPWRETDNPYRIWVSEIILQQTRVDQGLAYFERFVELFPTVSDLAAASLDDVLKAWEGLGYYSRARNVHEAARLVVDQHEGTLPRTYDELLTLPGIGPYTAAAVASLAFGEPRAVLDGNVIRVLSRLSALDEDVTRSPVRRRLQHMADELLDQEDPGRHNEAMMELGALVCTPSNPSCDACPVQLWCEARRRCAQTAYPVKRKKGSVPHYDIGVGVLRDDTGKVLIQKRPRDAMLGGLWEFPGGKKEPNEDLRDTVSRELSEELGISVDVREHVDTIAHAYSHFRITLHAYQCRLKSDSQEPSSGQPIKWVTREQLAEYAFPRANRRLIETLTAETDPHGS